MDKYSITLYSAQQGHQAFTEAWKHAKAELTAGRKVTLKLEPENKSRDQERFYHAIIGEIAKQAQHLGAKWEPEDLKRLMVAKFCKEIGLNAGRVIPNLDGDGIVQLDFQTRKFTKDQAGQFIEFLQAWAADNGVELSEQQA